jgi:hypothetical protein
MRGAIPPLPQYFVMAWCLVKHRDNFTFYLHKKTGDVVYFRFWKLSFHIPETVTDV